MWPFKSYPEQDSASNHEFDSLLNNLVREAEDAYRARRHWGFISSSVLSSYGPIRDMEPHRKALLALHLMPVLANLEKLTRRETEQDKAKYWTYHSLLITLLESDANYQDSDLIALLELQHALGSLSYLQATAAQLELNVTKYGLSDSMAGFIRRALDWAELSESGARWAFAEPRHLLQNLLNIRDNDGGSAFRFYDEDVLGKFANQLLDEFRQPFKGWLCEMLSLSMSSKALGRLFASTQD